MALNSTRPGRRINWIWYLGAVVMPRCSSRARSLPVRTGASAPKERVHFIGLVFYIMVLRVPLLLSRRALSHWTLRDHQLYRKMFLLL
jgi:hypothetical protein